MSRNKRTDKGVLFLIIFLVLLMLSAVIFAFLYIGEFTKASIIELEPINVTMISKNSDAKESEKHSVNMKFSLDGNERIVEKYGKKNVNQLIIDAISNEDYSKISSIDGTEYVKEVVSKKLQQELGEENINKVYIENFNVDFTIPQDAKDVPNPAKENMKGLFPNIKD